MDIFKLRAIDVYARTLILLIAIGVGVTYTFLQMLSLAGAVWLSVLVGVSAVLTTLLVILVDKTTSVSDFKAYATKYTSVSEGRIFGILEHLRTHLGRPHPVSVFVCEAKDKKDTLCAVLKEEDLILVGRKIFESPFAAGGDFTPILAHEMAHLYHGSPIPWNFRTFLKFFPNLFLHLSSFYLLLTGHWQTAVTVFLASEGLLLLEASAARAMETQADLTAALWTSPLRTAAAFEAFSESVGPMKIEGLQRLNLHRYYLKNHPSYKRRVRTLRGYQGKFTSDNLLPVGSREYAALLEDVKKDSLTDRLKDLYAHDPAIRALLYGD